MSDPGPDDMMSIAEVRRFFGGSEKPLNESTIYRWVRQGKLAEPIRMGPLTLRWRKKDCQEAMQRMADSSRRILR